MEKRKAHYRLSDIQAIVARERLNAFTATSIRNARLMGLDEAAMLAVVASMKSTMLYKSMTTHRDASLWQDVYHVPVDERIAYVKLTLCAGAVVIQFKDKESEL
jgi:motility quorum-sensing regulator / GCU-specific mRNA interferase toxin